MTYQCGVRDAIQGAAGGTQELSWDGLDFVVKSSDLIIEHAKPRDPRKPNSSPAYVTSSERKTNLI